MYGGSKSFSNKKGDFFTCMKNVKIAPVGKWLKGVKGEQTIIVMKCRYLEVHIPTKPFNLPGWHQVLLTGEDLTFLSSVEAYSATLLLVHQYDRQPYSPIGTQRWWERGRHTSALSKICQSRLSFGTSEHQY